jgi:hypothetical protein
MRAPADPDRAARYMRWLNVVVTENMKRCLAIYDQVVLIWSGDGTATIPLPHTYSRTGKPDPIRVVCPAQGEKSRLRRSPRRVVKTLVLPKRIQGFR